ncbi:MAG TPA: class I SAM-dependent methyltransferase [Aquella sp.]|nr:class I SAM-dependent methyltransferase [Aquella sp.]
MEQEYNKVKLNVGTKDSTNVEGYFNLSTEEVEYYPWDFDCESVDEILCANYLHYVHSYDRFIFFDEIYRVLKLGGTATIITPYWSNEISYVDPMIQWPPITPNSYNMYNATWRKINDFTGKDYQMQSNFAITKLEGTFNDDSKTKNRTEDVIKMRTEHYLNSVDNLVVILEKLPPVYDEQHD